MLLWKNNVLHTNYRNPCEKICCCVLRITVDECGNGHEKRINPYGIFFQRVSTERRGSTKRTLFKTVYVVLNTLYRIKLVGKQRTGSINHRIPPLVIFLIIYNNANSSHVVSLRPFRPRDFSLARYTLT